MPKKILVVDDEIDFLKIVKARLEKSGYSVVTATDGKEAIDKLKSEKFDAVLLDIMMPEVDGLDVLKRIRKEDKDLPVFILTAFSNEERFKLANNLNASGFIMKTSDLKKEIADITETLKINDKYKK